MPSPYSVIVLAGGRSRRMGADKAQMLLDGQRLIDHVLMGLASLPIPPSVVVIVSPNRLHLTSTDYPFLLHETCEHPTFGGPVAGIAAGAELLGPAFAHPLVVLSVDAPRAPASVPRVIAALAQVENADAACAVVEGRWQPLLAAWKPESLRDALRALPQVRDCAAKRLYEYIELLKVICPADARDCDSPEELAKFGNVSFPIHDQSLDSK